MPSVAIDIGNVPAEFSLTRDQVEQMIDYAVKTVTARFAENWELEAGKELNSTRNEYVRSLRVIDEGKLAGAVALSGELPMMLEQGASTFDMKEDFKNSDKAIQKEDGGWYLTIPFRIASSEALGESEVFSGVMPKDVHGIAKSKEVDESSGKSDPIKPNELPDKYQPQTKKVRIPKSNTFTEYQHKTSIYAGIRKEKDKETGQNRYTNFRRVSDNSDPASWIHPGFEAKQIGDRALNNMDIDTVIDQSVDDVLSQLGF